MALLHALVALGSGSPYLLALHARSRATLREPIEALPSGLAMFELRTPLDKLGDNWTKLWFEQVSFPRFCRRQGVDLAHVPYWASPFRPTVPTVVTIHDLIPLLLPLYRGNFLVRLYTRLVAASARRADYIVTDSEASRQDIVRQLHISPEKVQVVYLAADDRFCPVTDRATLDHVQRKYGLPNRYLLYLGGFDVRKNVPLLLQAYARLVQEQPDVPPLAIAGRLPPKNQDTAFFPSPQRRVSELGLTERVALIGWVDEEDKPALYTGAELFVFPSQYEGFGLPVLEALSCGTPAVVTQAGSLPEIVGEGGLQVQAGDVPGLAGAIERILQDAALREALREKGIQHASRFTWEGTARQMVAVYSRVYSGAAKGRPTCAS